MWNNTYGGENLKGYSSRNVSGSSIIADLNIRVGSMF